MPTFTAMALDTLLETGSRNPNPNPRLPPPPSKFHLPPIHTSEKKSVPSRPPHAASPILYATPDVTPLPDSPSSFPPSPYIINHKRRGPRLLKSFSHNSVIGGESQSVDIDFKAEATNMVSCEQKLQAEDPKEVANGSHVNLEDEAVGKEEAGKTVDLEVERGGEMDEFLDFQDSMSMSSNTEVDESNGGDRSSWKPGTPAGEYYDAYEEISSDGSARSSYRNIDDEFRELRLNLLMEIDKRKQAEVALEHLLNQWRSLSQQLSLLGLTLRTLESITNETGELSNLDPAEELCRQVVVARFVSDTIARGYSRAEIEMEMEPQIEAKNFEIARLSDRLQYYEAANREMSQRNQEAVEMARQERHRRKRRQRWIWSSIGVAVTLGAAAVAWSYIPSASKPEGETSASHGEGDQT